jgi:hypothetical protein
MAITCVFFLFMALSPNVLWMFLFLGFFVFDVAYLKNFVLRIENYMCISLDNHGQWYIFVLLKPSPLVATSCLFFSFMA